MKVLSLFSGVGGFDLGLEAAGMETVALCEWDRHAQSILRRHWPNTPLYGDVSELTGAQLIADGVYPDLVAFGSPCQDLSVAGKRAGLAGERSGLFHEATRIIRELRTLTDGTLPRWVVWENVVGALNSNAGADFGAVLDEMGNLGAHLIEWAVLDAQNYGVPQRRRRVFLVACLNPRTSARCPDPLLPVGQGSPRDLAPLREAWKASPAGSTGRARDVGLIDVSWWDGGDQADTITTKSDGQRMPDKQRLQAVAYGFSHYSSKATAVDGISPTLRADKTGTGHAVGLGSIVRRLTPRECERLMGWPDDWTRWTDTGKEQADSHRYKQIGNGVASPVAEWVGRQIFAAEHFGR